MDSTCHGFSWMFKHEKDVKMAWPGSVRALYGKLTTPEAYAKLQASLHYGRGALFPVRESSSLHIQRSMVTVIAAPCWLTRRGLRWFK